MPHLRFRAVDKDDVASLSRDLVTELAELTNAPAEHFTVELVKTRFYQGGQKVEGDPLCEVAWFDRGAETRDRAAKLITEHLKRLQPSRDAIVVFTNLEKAAYYENGQHFG